MVLFYLLILLRLTLQHFGSCNVYVTRLHVRYDAAHFPDDLMFRETNDNRNFQGRYILRHPYTGKASCSRGNQYRAGLPARFEKEAQTLASLTDWPITEIRRKMESKGQSFRVPAGALGKDKKWWRKVWPEKK